MKSFPELLCFFLKIKYINIKLQSMKLSYSSKLLKPSIIFYHFIEIIEIEAIIWHEIWKFGTITLYKPGQHTTIMSRTFLLSSEISHKKLFIPGFIGLLDMIRSTYYYIITYFWGLNLNFESWEMKTFWPKDCCGT